MDDIVIQQCLKLMDDKITKSTLMNTTQEAIDHGVCDNVKHFAN